MTSGSEADALLEATLASSRHWAARFGYVEERPVGLRLIPDALVTGRRYPVEGECLGAVYEPDGRLVKSSIRVSPGDVVAVDPETAPDVATGTRRVPRAIYGGILFLILGHFLFETVARLWLQVDAMARRGGRDGPLPVVLHPSPGFDLDVFMNTPFLRRSLEALGIQRHDLLLAEQDMRIDRLYYPDSLSIYHEYLHPQMGRVLDHVGDGLARPRWLTLRPPAKRHNERVFLSRRRWRPNARIANEADLENLFEERGFAIVHPERLRPAELVRRLRSTRLLAASDGSHAHLAAFCRPGTRMLVLDTRPVPTQFAIEKMRGFESLHIPLHETENELWDADSRKVVPQRLALLIDTILSRGIS